MKSPCETVCLVIACLMMCASSSTAEIGPITLKELVADSDIIAIGRVTRIFPIKGVDVAQIQTSTQLKGRSLPSIYVLNVPTWTCDISRVDSGKTYVFFLHTYKFSRHPTASAGAERLLSFQEPIGFKKKVWQTIGKDFFQLGHAGRGQMPLRTVDEVEFATVRIGDVLLPDQLKSIPGPDERYPNDIRSVPLGEFVKAIKAEVEARAVKIGH